MVRKRRRKVRRVQRKRDAWGAVTGVVNRSKLPGPVQALMDEFGDDAIFDMLMERYGVDWDSHYKKQSSV